MICATFVSGQKGSKLLDSSELSRFFLAVPTLAALSIAR